MHLFGQSIPSGYGIDRRRSIVKPVHHLLLDFGGPGDAGFDQCIDARLGPSGRARPKLDRRGVDASLDTGVPPGAAHGKLFQNGWESKQRFGLLDGLSHGH